MSKERDLPDLEAKYLHTGFFDLVDVSVVTVDLEVVSMRCPFSESLG